jgi:hypothetical protein
MFLPSQKNLLHKAIQKHLLKPRDFTVTANEELRLTHKPTGFYFRITIEDAVIYTNGGKEPRLFAYSNPKREGVLVNVQEESRHERMKDWTIVEVILERWLSWLKSEVEQPDLWAEMEHEPYLFDDAETVTEELFTEAEIKLLEARVPEVEQQIIDLNLPSDAQAAITAIVRKVPVKAKRFTKKELSDSLVGSFVRVGFKWELTTADIGEVWLVSQRFFTLALP